MFVKIKSFVENMVGCDDTTVYEFPDGTPLKELEGYAEEVSRDNADMYGAFERAESEAEECGVEESDIYSYSVEVLEGVSREEIEEEYGDIQEA